MLALMKTDDPEQMVALGVIRIAREEGLTGSGRLLMASCLEMVEGLEQGLREHGVSREKERMRERPPALAVATLTSAAVYNESRIREHF
jgi:hypothetical protein